MRSLRQRAEAVTTLGIGRPGTALPVAAVPSVLGMVAFWPTLLAVLMIFDILSDCVADFILSTSDRSAKHPEAACCFLQIIPI